MSGREADVLTAIEELERDEIDDLVDAQMCQPMSGYDHNINQPKCLHCRGDAHALPIKKRMREIRSLWQSTIQYYEGGERVSPEAVAALDAYRYVLLTEEHQLRDRVPNCQVVVISHFGEDGERL